MEKSGISALAVIGLIVVILGAVLGIFYSAEIEELIETPYVETPPQKPPPTPFPPKPPTTLFPEPPPPKPGVEPEVIEVTGAFQEVVVSSDRPVVIIRVSGLNNFIIIPYGVWVTEIWMDGIDHRVYIPMYLNPERHISGLNCLVTTY
ncbi:MAG: hypothetical protein ACE5OY_04385 [Candidatus Bathyarchaeia archaeon]